MAATKATKEQVEKFFDGNNPLERIIKVELSYGEDKACVIYKNEDGTKYFKMMDFYPFLWSTASTAKSLFDGDKNKLVKMMNRYNIRCKGLETTSYKGVTPQRMKNGYTILWEATSPMSYSAFLRFFKEGGVSVYVDEEDGTSHMNEGLMAVAPNEQFMIENSMRYFKGYENYDDLLKMTFDLETEGLDPNINHISQIGIRTNKGFEKILTVEGNTPEEKSMNEVVAIGWFAHYIKQIWPDVICGHNTENFDWNFIDKRCELDWKYMPDAVKKQVEETIGKRARKSTDPNKRKGMMPFMGFWMFKGPYKEAKASVLKLGGEVEYYKKTKIWGMHVTDSLMAVRRAQALDSNMEKADLKYVTKYSNLNKKNRVYMKNGNQINSIWLRLDPSYAFNNENGHWFELTEKEKAKTYGDEGKLKYSFEDPENKHLVDNETGEKFEMVTGRYVIERYLMDDLYEGEKVEERYNEPNFLVDKMVPISFETLCTGGTAKIWKYIMVTWSYENGLAIPESIPTRKFTGGLSRLLSVGYNPNVAKFDYHSLYPTTQITFDIETDLDLTGVELTLLEHVLSQREKYKALKGKWGKEVGRIKDEIEKCQDKEQLSKLKDDLQVAKRNKSGNDKKQLPLKIVANSYFGSTGSSVFPWADLTCAEETTCCGRQMLRLMIKHFTDLGYHPLVGDSVVYDTPIIIKYDDPVESDESPYPDKMITADVITIEQAFNEKEAIDCGNGQFRDFSKKGYKVLTKNGWSKINYIYRHKTNKKIYRIDIGNSYIEVTEDHSLFSNGKEVSPKSLKEGDSVDVGKSLYHVLHKESFPLGFERTGKVREALLHSIGFSLITSNTALFNHLPSSKEIKHIYEVGPYDNYVYDISANGTFICANGMIVCHNTDGFNFQIPDSTRYTDEHPYISKGLCRYTVKGKKSTGFQADVDEFNDMYMRRKSALDIDEVIPCSVNIKRKNYLDLLDDQSVKLVGNTVKSKKMPIYIKKFLDKAVGFLLTGKGKEFVDFYYDYIDKIYNLQIPLRDIASVGKIKTSIDSYKDSCKQLTKSGGKKARQAWYELVIKDNLSVHMGDAVYYINTGSKPKDSDVQRISHLYTINIDTKGKEEVTKEAKREYAKFRKENKGNLKELGKYKNVLDFTKNVLYPDVWEEDELKFNCIRLDNAILEDDKDHFCDESFEYNVPKYIEMFNNRIQPLFVCFDKSIRSSVDKDGNMVDDGYGIMIDNPEKRKSFTAEELRLHNKQPFSPTDQDTYEALMTMEDKEVEFWINFLKTQKAPLPWAEFFEDGDTFRIEPIYIDQNGMDWKKIVDDYNKRLEALKEKEVMDEMEIYKNTISNLSKADIDKFLDDGIIPSKIEKIAKLDDKNTFDFISKKHGIVLGHISDIIDSEAKDY